MDKNVIIQSLKRLNEIAENLIIDCDDADAVTNMAMQQQDIINQLIDDIEK